VTDPMTETVPELTPEQYALLDAVRDVALSAEAPAAQHAGNQLVRMAAERFGLPIPEREGGLAEFLFGSLVRTVDADTAEEPCDHASESGDEGPIADLGRMPKRWRCDSCGRVRCDAEPWPFKAGTIVRDEDGAEAEWLDAAPAGVVVVSAAVGTLDRELWAQTAGDHWLSLDADGSWITSQGLVARGPVRVASVPEPLEACTDDAPAGDV